MTATTTAGALVALSQWIDAGNADRNPEAAMWGRLSKIGEEFGEVIEAVIGVTGQNPRKGRTHTWADVEAELLDVAVTALGALEHIREHDGQALALLGEKIRAVHVRALASPAPAPCWCMACEHLHVRARTEAGDPLAMFARRFIVCPDCGNKRCPRATHHGLACTGSNEPGQPGSAYQQVVAPPASAEELRARILDQPGPAPRDRYAQCDGTCTADCGACKGKGPR